MKAAALGCQLGMFLEEMKDQSLAAAAAVLGFLASLASGRDRASAEATSQSLESQCRRSSAALSP